MNDHPTELPIAFLFELDVPYKEAKRRLLDQFESTYFAALIRKHDHNLSAASREAHLSRRHLRSLLRRYGLYRVPGSAPDAAAPDLIDVAADFDSSLEAAT
jgi:hypothetical protein